jgi:uncharacterized protein with GYD domain
MPTYIVLLKWTDAGIKAVKDAPARAKDAAALMEKMGGRLKDVYWTLGEYDNVSIVEAPDDETLMAMLLSLGSRGNSRTETLRALTAEEFQSVVVKVP